MAIATDSPTQQIINKIHTHIQNQGGQSHEWYVGIANSLDRLFVAHNVPRQNAWRIYDYAPSAAVARAVEKAFHDWGCKGAGGGGDDDTNIVYAYLITSTTRE